MQKVVKELADAVGLADAIELVRRWGGRTLYVPMNVKSTDPLALTIGLDSARRLVDAFGGVELRLPLERNALLDLRNAAIVAEAEARVSFEAIAIRYGLTRQRVAKIVRAAGESVPVTGSQEAIAE